MARIEAGAPQVTRQSTTSTQAERTPAAAGAEHTVVQGDTLSKLAKEAYGDASKWTLIRDANPSKVKMRGDTPIIQVGATLTIPEPPSGWGAKPSGQRRAVATEQTAPAQQAAPGAVTSGQVFANARQNLQAMEFQLQGLPQHQREQFMQSLARGEPPPQGSERAAQATSKFVNDLREQVGRLPADQQANVQQLLEQEQSRFPHSSRAIDAMGTAVDADAQRTAATPKLSAAVEAASRDGMLEVRELGTVVRALAEDVKAARTPEQQEATSQAAMQRFEQLLRSNSVPEEQRPAFLQAFGMLSELAAADAPPEHFEQLGRQLESLPPMVGQGAQNVPQSPAAPNVQRAVTESIRDGELNLREFASVIRALSSDSQQARGDEARARQTQEQANQLMMYLFQNVRLAPGQEQDFAVAAQALGELVQRGNATPRDVERLAFAIEQGTLGR